MGDEEFVESVIELMKKGKEIYLCPECGLVKHVMHTYRVRGFEHKIYDVLTRELRDVFWEEEEVELIESLCPICGSVVEPLGSWLEFSDIAKKLIKYIKQHPKAKKESLVLKRMVEEGLISSSVLVANII